MLVGASNAVNLTDGLDGLAIGTFAIAAAAFTALAYVTGHRVLADYLLLVHFPQSAELTIFCGSLVGASLGFLWYNSYPADIFMGDVGSLALGGALGTVAILIKQELLLPIVGGVFVLEALSVILQVASFKLTGKRIFKMAPLHHHFELIGWSEPKVITRFLIVAIIFALFSLTTLKLQMSFSVRGQNVTVVGSGAQRHRRRAAARRARRARHADRRAVRARAGRGRSRLRDAGVALELGAHRPETFTVGRPARAEPRRAARPAADRGGARGGRARSSARSSSRRAG